MKIRSGFVSNSSSSSFCIFGVSLDTSEFKKTKAYQQTLKELADKEGKTPEELEESWGVYEISEGIKLPDDFSMHQPPEFETVYIGRSWTGIKDDETGAQFKENVRTVVKEMLGNQTFAIHEVSWYNG